jgi:signal transduction histidine kinase/ligand-binding sensor domain-containing protein/CheY-like chemotaxis protein/AraC-like DNA-binding protein
MNTAPKYCLALLALFVAHSAYTQTTKFYSTEQGLSNSLINHIYQDKKGFIWISTENGLNKFDGARFIVYEKLPNDSVSLKSNHVKTVFEDSSGKFWVRCSGGLMLYDRDMDTFHDIDVKDGDNQPINLSVISIYELRNGDIYFATGYGLYSLAKGDSAIRPVSRLNRQFGSLLLTTIYEDSRGRLWIGTENSGVYVYDFKTSTLLQFSSSSPPHLRIGNNTISAICEDDNNDVFVGTLFGGLYRFDPNLASVTPIPDAGGNRTLPVKSLIFNKARQLLAGTDGYGLKKYNSSLNRLEQYEPFSAPFDFSTSKIHQLLQDNDGNTWAGIYQKGIFFIPSNLNRFKYYGYKSFRHNIIGSNCVRVVYKDADNVVWIGADNDGLYAVDENAGTVRHYQSDGAPNAVPGAILCIHDAGNGKLWLGSYLNGIAVFDKKTGSCTYINSDTDTSFICNKVYSIISDRQGGLWISTYGNGIFRYDINASRFVEHYCENETNPNPEGLTNNWVNSLILDDNNLLWMGTMNGLSCLDTQTRTFRNYRKANSNLPSNVIFALQSDRYGNIWISTDEGLVQLNPHTGNIQHFTTQHGIASNEICAIAEDNYGNIWMSTLSGISKYSPADNKFTNFYASDGLQGNEFSYRAFCKSHEGEIFFGGVNGVTGFFPDEIHNRQAQLNVYVTHFYLYGKPVHRYQKSGGKTIFNTPVLQLEEIRLAASDNVFGFEFSTIGYANSEETSFRYKLDNPDAQWMTTLSGANRIAYANLPPGRYRLLYQAVDKENESAVRAITIIIRPPWYASTPAMIIYALMILTAAYAIYLFISARIKQRNEMIRLEHADQINEAKLQFFTNISHEIRTPMTLIMGPLEKLLMTGADPKLRNTYLLIYRNAQRILRLINQLMDIRKIDRGQMHIKARETDIVGFIKDVMQAFEYLAQKKNITLSFETPRKNLKVWIDLNNFDKVLFNILSNAFKFTPENGAITISLREARDPQAPAPLKTHFEIRILDTGPGIDREQIELIFERFYQIDNEVTNSNYGAGVGLHLARSIVELQHGTIHAENRTDQAGSAFIIRMPMGSAHLDPSEIEVDAPQSSHPPFTNPRNETPLDQPAASHADNDSVQARTKYRILIVEDDSEIAAYIAAELAPIYKVHRIDNGRDALDYILTETTDLVISDILMPRMDGITLSRKIKQNVRIHHIPVVLLTAKHSDDDMLEGLETGADAYLVKPFHPEILKKTVRNLLDNRERQKNKSRDCTEGKITAVSLKSYDEALMERILRIVNNNLGNPALNVEMLSAEVGISRVHLHRKLKELANQSARDFIRTIRLKQAGELLSGKKLAVSQVYEAVGFTNFSHFSISFREFYGMTPTEYMNRHKP